jgi:23S rRNA pseudouridine1911/1915/1917 synthase
MDRVEFQWLQDRPTLKEALQDLLGSSGQVLKKHFSSKQLSRRIEARDLVSLPLDYVNHLAINPIYDGPLPHIIKDTADFLVLHKPPFVHCHPLCYSDKDTLLNFLSSLNKLDTLLVNRDNYDRGLLYRLDYETSGVIVLAKKENVLSGFRNDFSRMKSKYYWAIVEGDFNRDGRWEHYFRAAGSKGHRQVVSDIPKGDSISGTLKVKKILVKEGKSLLLVKLETGLRHQIRAQLSFLGFPILGDELYGSHQAERLFLHALKYQWENEAEDPNAELFGRFFDMNSALQMSHDMFRGF